MCLKVNHYTHYSMLCKSLQRHQKKGEHTARETWSLPESKLHINYLEAEGGISSPKRVPRPLLRQDISCSNRQYYSRVKQGRRHEVGPTLYTTVENLDLECQETSDSQSPTHSRLAEW